MSGDQKSGALELVANYPYTYREVVLQTRIIFLVL